MRMRRLLRVLEKPRGIGGGKREEWVRQDSRNSRRTISREQGEEKAAAFEELVRPPWRVGAALKKEEENGEEGEGH